jgi:hypothetical protein
VATLLRRGGTAFAELALQPSILEKRMADQLKYDTGHRAAPAELRSWTGSLPILAQDLTDAGLGNVEVLLEYRLPLTSRRADVVLAGRHPKTGAPSYVVVELKQWSRAHPFDASGELVTVAGVPGGPRRHPVGQVRDYCDYLVDFTRSLHGEPDPIAGAAYLHNAGHDVSMALGGYPQSGRGRLFTGADRGDFVSFLQERLSPDTAGAPFADLLLRSAVAPSRQLLKVAAEEIAGREQFVLLDEQVVAVQSVLHLVETARQSDHKTVVIVTGGPGSGKSVIALSLLGRLAERGYTAIHATGSRSFTMTMRKVSGKNKTRASSLFKYFNQFGQAGRNDLDTLILDEAHRLRATSENRYTKAEHRTGTPQIDELMAAARVPVFLLDEHQVVRPGEMGTAAEIENRARAAGLQTILVSLDGQFRCGGSERYIQWSERLLGLRAGGAHPWEPDPPFHLSVADSPDELVAVLDQKRADGYGARMAAGYCWPWSDPRSDGSLVDDVQIGSWSRPWNLRGDRSLPGAPPAALWATDDGGFGQVGCVYTAQGFEYDWNGVILGPDLVWREDRWIARREHNRDPDFRSRKTVSDEEFDRLVRHVYKVLLTRGMVGTVLYSTDEETRRFLATLVP